jgi:hypothetical protein
MKREKKKIKKWIYWTPRVLSIIFIFFLALFSLDVIGTGLSFWGTVLALIIHSIPSILLLIVLLISWKYEIVGGVAYILAGLAYIIILATSSNFEGYMLSWSAIIAGPAFVIGILFLINWRKKGKFK